MTLPKVVNDWFIFAVYLKRSLESTPVLPTHSLPARSTKCIILYLTLVCLKIRMKILHGDLYLLDEVDGHYGVRPRAGLVHQSCSDGPIVRPFFDLLLDLLV